MRYSMRAALFPVAITSLCHCNGAASAINWRDVLNVGFKFGQCVAGAIPDGGTPPEPTAPAAPEAPTGR